MPNPLTTAIASLLPPTSAHLLPLAPTRHDIYPPLLLLPASAFASEQWTHYLTETPTFLPSLAAALNVTHIATASPIPASSTTRSPRLHHLHPVSPDAWPDLWVSTIQNGITQTWNPTHTMFSRGNITEKARVLTFPHVAAAEIADLYAGIGYFAFSYLRAGAKRVWCWEINPHSVEALRRGAALNGWGFRMGEERDQGQQVVAWAESNVHAADRIGRGSVAHVNLGLLPTSRGAWAQAVSIVRDGGWVHVHENVGVHEVEGRRGEVVEELRRLAAGRSVMCEHTQMVKTFAPGVWHVVFDVRVGEAEGC